MAPDLRAVLVSFALMAAWVLLPLVPAWATYRITPGQRLGLKGPFEPLTLNATGSFVAYLVVALLLGRVALPALAQTFGYMFGEAAGRTSWLVTGRALLLDAEGEPVSRPPEGLPVATVRVVPEQNVIDRNLAINVLLPASKTASVVYIDVPGWGGASISLADPESYEEDALYRRIRLKNVVNLRKQSELGVSVASRPPGLPPAPVTPASDGGG